LNKNENILNMDADERYLYFIRKITDFELIWGLYNEGWAMAGNQLNQEVIVFWPERGFAEICQTGAWKNYKPKEITLADFISKWLPGMEKDNKKAGVFYTPKGQGVVLEPGKILQDINEELKQY
jgi:hypothetical protein